MTPVTTRFGVMAPVVGRIREKATFRALLRSRRRGAAGPLTVSYCAPERAPERAPDGSGPGGAGLPRVGYAVSKNVGNAVVRNRVRRRLRAAMGSLASSLPSGAYLVRAAPGSVDVGFRDTCDLLGRAARAAARLEQRAPGRRAPGGRAPGVRA